VAEETPAAAHDDETANLESLGAGHHGSPREPMPLVLLATSLSACPNPGEKKPQATKNCSAGRYGFPLNTSGFDESGEHVSEQINDVPGYTYADETPTRSERRIVQIRLYQDTRLMGVGTGTIVGRETILIAAHTF